MSAPFTYCDGCDGHNCDAEKGCAYPGVASLWLVKNVHGDIVGSFPTMEEALESDGGLWEGDTATEWVPAASIAALVAERDDLATRAAVIDEALTNAIHMRREFEAALATANARITKLEKALKPFAGQAGSYDTFGLEFVPDEFEPSIGGHTIGDLRRARTALKGGKDVALATANARVERYREALEPSGDTKAAYSGEFHERIEIANPLHEDNEDDEPETIMQYVPVSWTTIKEIMAAISKRAALTGGENG